VNPDLILATGHLSLWLLLIGLFFPRLALFIAWLEPGNYPPNNLPDLVNFFSWLVFPRFLMAYYIYLNIGPNNLWFWAYVILGIIGLFGEGGLVHRRVTRTTRNLDGSTTTTVEEEV
jgi:hypothetical protein